MTLGEIIKAYRDHHDLSLQDFADISGLSKGYVSMVEKGINGHTGKPLSPSVETLEKCAKAMGTTAKTLFAITENQLKMAHFDEVDGRSGFFLFDFTEEMKQEEELLDAFRKLDDGSRSIVLNMVKGLAAKEESK